MKLKKARTCEGCRAFTSGNNPIQPCQLHFNNYGGYDSRLGLVKRIPQEPCYKPMTIPDLFLAMELVRNK